MGFLTAFVLAATSLIAPAPPGGSKVASVQVEIVRAERVGPINEAGGVYRKVRRSAEGAIIDFE